ncbi:AAA domain-containing protein [Clostridium neonatale]|uniref:AAA domain-containing protein n=1 Tax=Clostridium neonatale TaxID=137838 RepID=UPI00291BF9A0|nr:DNA/RNA helicase, superfamily I [Clostridium neonatale]CAI3585431.1 DNA/RNA helicase, superfamily I [Clostridium neonatale]CAI3614164.1 DNA/RNA helicase, superfamily I [Clostridium neonatale]CAI3629086.1 DNA/RNA helicase, superfamily I [Clostridium neonatale]CAI3683866.1 DNA/RNA helicase, superfamily I [Clostridium neonatale]
MNIEKNLILIKNEDATEKVKFINRNNGMCDVTFISNKTYKYSNCNVQWTNKSVEVEADNVIVYENNIPISGIMKIIKFDELNYLRLIFKTGYQKAYHKNALIIMPNYLKNESGKECFSYLKELANNLDFKNNTDLISKQFEHIVSVNPESVLANYLSKGKIDKAYDYNDNDIIFPFGFNLSQKEATEKALKNKISVIEGPPGTGKTQTILNLIANAVINNKTVAIVSNNNAATLNVFEKLKRNNVDFLSAYLGNKENKKSFFENQTGEYPEFNDFGIDDDKLENLKMNLQEEKIHLDEMLENQNELAKVKMEKASLTTEKVYFEEYNNEIIEVIAPIRINNSEKLMSLLVEYNMIVEKNEKIHILDKFKLLIKYGIWNFNFYKNSPEIIQKYLLKMYYEVKLEELNNKINKLESRLNKYNFDSEMKNYSDNSMMLFKHILYKKYHGQKERAIYGDDILWKKLGVFLDDYPVILSTTYSLRSCVSANYLFDYVIVDEASQVDIVSGALAISCAKNIVIVGDLKQLPNVVEEQMIKISDMIFNKYKLEEAYRYSKNSLLASISKLYEDLPKTLLKEHYRCHPKIIDFCNKKFYNDQLIILAKGDSNNEPLKLYKTVKGNHSRNRYSQRQIDVIIKEVLPELENYKSIGITSPYNAQINMLRQEIKKEHIEIDTIHKYQGREKEIIILTTVSDNKDDFMDNPNLLNVAVSRAEHKLIVIVSGSDDFLENNNTGDLIRYIQYNNFQIINSKIYSIFDLLYTSYSAKLLEFYSKHKKVSEFDSENLMNTLIEEVLDIEEYNSLGKIMHYPLNVVIRDTSSLNEEELRFVSNILTHVDFMIFRKIDKSPVLVVEVDGYNYHQNNPKQLERDRLKDRILEKYNIPILRLPTNGSEEEEKLKEKLKDIMK